MPRSCFAYSPESCIRSCVTSELYRRGLAMSAAAPFESMELACGLSRIGKPHVLAFHA